MREPPRQTQPPTAPPSSGKGSSAPASVRSATLDARASSPAIRATHTPRPPSASTPGTDDAIGDRVTYAGDRVTETGDRVTPTGVELARVAGATSVASKIAVPNVTVRTRTSSGETTPLFQDDEVTVRRDVRTLGLRLNRQEKEPARASSGPIEDVDTPDEETVIAPARSLPRGLLGGAPARRGHGKENGVTPAPPEVDPAPPTYRFGPTLPALRVAVLRAGPGSGVQVVPLPMGGSGPSGAASAFLVASTPEDGEAILRLFRGGEDS